MENMELFQCTICGADYTENRNLRRHTKQKHADVLKMEDNSDPRSSVGVHAADAPVRFSDLSKEELKRREKRRRLTVDVDFLRVFLKQLQKGAFRPIEVDLSTSVRPLEVCILWIGDRRQDDRL